MQADVVQARFADAGYASLQAEFEARDESGIQHRLRTAPGLLLPAKQASATCITEGPAASSTTATFERSTTCMFQLALPPFPPPS
jgi:hypothetical protein